MSSSSGALGNKGRRNNTKQSSYKEEGYEKMHQLAKKLTRYQEGVFAASEKEERKRVEEMDGSSIHFSLVLHQRVWKEKSLITITS